MFSWKERLYAFLLKRLLGPYLTVESQQQLYTRIEQISLTEGTYVFSDLSFDTDFISSKLKQKVAFQIVKATVRKIQIDIKLQEDSYSEFRQQAEASSEGNSSFAWKALKFGINTASNTNASVGDDKLPDGKPPPSTIALSVRIRLEGLSMVLEPNAVDNFFMGGFEQSNDDSNESTSSKRSYLSSFLEAALASVRLSVEVLDIRLRFHEAVDPTSLRQRFLEFRIQSLLYYDVRDSGSASSASSDVPLVEQMYSTYETIVHKALEITHITVLSCTRSLDEIFAADPLAARSKSVGLLDGTTRCSLRVIEYRSVPNDSDSTKILSSQEEPSLTTSQHDFQVAMNQKLNLSVDLDSLQSIRAVVNSYATSYCPWNESLLQKSPSQSTVATNILQQHIKCAVDDDDADYKALEGIMAQYREARLLVERKEVRGGILVPSIDEGGDVTFDAFFDANEHGHMRYSSVLRDSILGSILYNGSEQQQYTDSIRTKFTLHLQEGGIKLSFPSVGNDMHEPSEFVLLTFNDVNLSCQMSSKCSEYTFSIQHIELEDGILDRFIDTTNREVIGFQATPAIEVGTILRFVSSCDFGDDEDEIDLLIEAPCVSLSIKVDREERKDLMNVEMVMEPLEIAYRIDTLSKLCQVLQNDVQHNPPVVDTMKPKHKTVSFAASCASITVLLPMKSELDLSHMYQRTGYSTECVLGRDPTVGCCFERLHFELTVNQTDDVDNCNGISISCHNFVAFVSSPMTRHNAFDYAIYRFDFMAVCCPIEADPCFTFAVFFTPLAKSDISSDDGSCPKTLAQSLFPIVPSLSSFKNRQDDYDEDVSAPEPSNIEGHSRDWNTGDPQSVMLLDASFSDVVISIHICEIVVDVSASEIRALHEMVSCVQKRTGAPSSIQTASVNHVSQKQIACSAICDRFSLSLQMDRDSKETFEDDMVHSSTFLLTMDQSKLYCIVVGPSPKHIRCTVYDFDFLEMFNINQRGLPSDVSCNMERIRAVRQRGSCRPDSKTFPILYRSHLFTPISPGSPSFLLDFLHITESDQGNATRTLYAYLFNVTYRHEYDSIWIHRLYSVLPERSTESSKSDPLVLRVFLFIADCNFDYSSAPRFKTAARIILRVGDLRISSNLVTPMVGRQAVSLSLGDVALLVCRCRFPYNFDNARMLNGPRVMKPEEISVSSLGLLEDAEASDILRCMNYRTMLTMTVMDAFIVLSTNIRTNLEPSICVTLTLGQICLLACRDSFAHLMASITEGSAEITAVTADTVESLKSKSTQSRVEDVNAAPGVGEFFGESPIKGSVMPHTSKDVFKSHSPRDFLLDGYDWTAIDSEEIGKPGIPSGDEQSARWYGDSGPALSIVPSFSDSTITTVGTDSGNFTSSEGLNTKGPPIVTHHFQLHPVSDPISDGDMGASKYTDSNIKPQVNTRVIVHDLAVRIRFFDGYDWPEYLDESERNAPKCEYFLIPEVKKPLDNSDGVSTSGQPCDGSKNDRKSKLMGDLLSNSSKPGGTFDNIPLPEEHSKKLKNQSDLRRLARRINKFFQVECSGVVARLDSMQDCSEHRLVSCLNLCMHDFFLAETMSSDKPVKMIGEWFNEQEHPRDSKDGLILLKMVTWHPLMRVTPDGRVANDESDVTVKILPLRCFVDQRAVSFVRAFFNSKDGDESSCLPPHLNAVPPPLFTMFRVQPLKLKVDYRPQKLDTKALRSGDVVELINLSPLDGMVLTLKSVSVVNEIGFGAAIYLVVRRWVEDICATQLHKFVTKSRALEPITEVGHAATDLVVLPWEAFKNGESMQKALRAGTKSFSKAVMFEVLNTSSRVAGFVGSNVSRITASAAAAANTSQRTGGNLLPTRPVPMPRGILETGPHAVESLSRGLQEATYTVVIVPYREYHRTGATGAVQSVIKGIPVAIVAPTSGVAEALSYTLLGARNQIRPDIRKEDEASLRGLHPT